MLPRERMHHIESSSNETFRRLRSLLETKGIKKEKQFMVFGRNPIEEVCKAAHLQTRMVLGTQDQADEVHRLNRFLPENGQSTFLSKPLFEELNVFGIDYPILVCASPEFKTWDGSSKEASVICPFQNPQNLGGALRSALAFGLKVILPREAAYPLHPRCMRALSGNIFAHNIEVTSSIKEIPQTSNLVVVDQGGRDISKFKFPKDCVLVIGEEGQGIPESLSKAVRTSILINENQESLNAMAALSIAAYAYRVQNPIL